MFALGAKGSRDEKHFIKLGGDISNTCHESYRRTGAANVLYKSELIFVLSLFPHVNLPSSSMNQCTVIRGVASL